MEFKKTLANCITIAVCVIALCISSVVGVGKISDAKIKTAGAASPASSDNIDGDVTSDPTGDVTEDPTADPGAVDPTGDVTEDPAADAGDATETPAADNGNTGTTNAANNSGSSSTPAATNAANTGSSAPKTAAQIITYYNNATAKVVDSKAGFSKVRYTDNEQMNAGAVMKSFKSLIYKFMGIGSENKYEENVTKGNWGDKTYMMKSKLAASDVTSATCTTSGNNYVITLKLKNGSSAANKSNPTTNPTTALDKCGINVGVKDKSYYDHKSASVVYDAIEGTYAGADIKESYSGATVKATINSKTGQMVTLNVVWNISMAIDIKVASGTATGTSHVTYSNFKF
ncbi:MAG: hypothetical protein PUB20_05420 [Clostridia bacterium]|nr:hypothetical protein [Clostridia bacterium]